MATMHEIQVWVLVNDQGEYVAHEDDGTLAEVYEERIGAIAEAAGTRRICLTVQVPLPETIELTGKVEVQEQAGELKVA